MTLRLALRIDGDARGASEAAQSAARDVENLGKATDRTNAPISEMEAYAKRAGVSVADWREGMKNAADAIAKMRGLTAAATGAIGQQDASVRRANGSLSETEMYAKRAGVSVAEWRDGMKEAADAIASARSQTAAATGAVGKHDASVRRATTATKDATAAIAEQRATLRALATVFALTGGPAGQLASTVNMLASNALKLNVAAVATVAAFGAVAAAAIAAVAAYAKFEAQQARLLNVLQATSGAAGQGLSDLNALADGMARAGTQSTDEIRSAIQELLRFRSVAGANFPAVMKAAQDLSNTFGGELRTNVQAFGRAFEDPINGLDGLRAAGLRISPVQEKLIADFARSGQLARAYAEILRLASEQLGGATAKSADTTAAAYGRLTNAVSRYFEVAGKSGDFGLRSVLDWLAKKANEAADAMERLQKAEAQRHLLPLDRMRVAGGLLPRRYADRVGVQFDEFFPGAGTEARPKSDLYKSAGPSAEDLARLASQKDAINKVIAALQLEAKVAGMTAVQRESYVRAGAAMVEKDSEAARAIAALVNEVAALQFMAQVRQQFIVQSEALRVEAAVFAMAAGAAAAYRYEHEKLAQAKAAGIALSDRRIAKIREEAAETGRLTQRVADLQAAKAAADAVGGAMVDALFSWASGAKSASDAIRDLTLSLGKMLLQASLIGQGPLAGIFGTGQSGGLLGGLLNGIFNVGGGKARGGYVSANDNFKLGIVANDNFAVGTIARRAAGGMIRGPGTSTSDSIPTLLSDGEYVVNARATARHRPLLEAINAGTARGFAAGGFVMPPPPTASAAGSGGAAPTVSIGGTSITVQGNLDEKTWPRVQAELAKRDAEMTGKVLRIFTDAQSRGII